MISYRQFLEQQRYGLADPDPGELKKPHSVSDKDVELAKQCVQLMMGRNLKWHRTLYKFLRRAGTAIPDINRLVDQMQQPKPVSPKRAGRSFDDVAPSSADSSPAFYQQ